MRAPSKTGILREKSIRHRRSSIIYSQNSSLKFPDAPKISDTPRHLRKSIFAQAEQAK